STPVARACTSRPRPSTTSPAPSRSSHAPTGERTRSAPTPTPSRRRGSTRDYGRSSRRSHIAAARRPFTTAVRELSTPAAFAVMFGSAFALLAAVALWTRNGQRLDAATLGAFDVLRADALLRAYGVRDWLTGALLLAAAIAGVEALVRRAWRAAA